MMRAWRAIALLALAMPCVASAQDQRDAEQRLQKVRSELKAVASERRQLEGARGDASRKLREADQQVGGVQRALRQTESTLQRDSASLAQMQAERTRLAGDLGAKQAEISRLLRAAQLAEQELGRAHYRALYFIARQPGLTVGDLLRLLAITKQSLGRVLNDLVARELVAAATGELDRRQKNLRLTATGTELRPGSPEDLATFQAAEIDKWKRIVTAAGIELQ